MGFKQYVYLALLLIVALVIAIAAPAGLLATVLVQILALAVVGAGGAKLSKPVISIVVLIVAGGIALFQVNGAFPPLPVYAGDPAAFVGGLFAWVQSFVTYATPIVGSAMLLYNVILEKVLKLIGSAVGLRLEPK